MSNPFDRNASAAPYSIGSTLLPGVSKLAEEIGETVQVLAKLLGSGGQVEHWDGTNLRDRLIEEIGDMWAASDYFLVQSESTGVARYERRIETARLRTVLNGADAQYCAGWPYNLASETWPGLRWLLESCAWTLLPVSQVLDNFTRAHSVAAVTASVTRIAAKLGGLSAALDFFVSANSLDTDAITARIEKKLALFQRWHDEARAGHPSNSPS